MPAIDYTITRQDDSGNETVHDLLLHYSAHRAIRGARERSTGVPLEPDEPAGIEFEGAFDMDGQRVELTPRETERAEQACHDDYEDRCRDL